LLLLCSFNDNGTPPLLLPAQQKHPDGLMGIKLFEHQVRYWQRAYSKKEGKHKISDHLALSFGRAFNVNGVWKLQVLTVEVNLNEVWCVPRIKLQPLGSQGELQFPPLLGLWLPWPTEYAVLLPEWQEQEPGRCPPLPSQDSLLPLGVVVWQIGQ
jgi:hypothetical protein